MKLFKYLPPERIDVLENLRVRFTPPVVFNDPFESRPHIVYDTAKEDMARVMEIEFKRNKIPEVDRQSLRRLHENNQLGSEWPEVLRLMVEIMASSTLALSLSEKPDNLLMWSHYTRSHEGFVLGFDADHSFFKGKGKGIYKLTKVVYSTKRPNVGLSKLSLVETYFTKSIDWEYEQEWRLFADANDACMTVEAQDFPICLFDLPADAVTEIILGYRSRETLRDRISSVLSLNNKLQHVTLKRAVINEKEYTLDIYPIGT